MKPNMQKLENERIYKYCGFVDHVSTWLRTHVRFLRAGDRFQIGDEKFLATGDPYFRQAKEKPIMTKVLSGEVFDEPESGWTINFVKER